MSTSPVVSFRVGQRLAAKLEERAAALGLSPGDYAKLVLIHKLEGAHEAELEARLCAIDEALQSLRHDVSQALAAILLNLTGATEAQVRALLDGLLVRGRAS